VVCHIHAAGFYGMTRKTFGMVFMNILSKVITVKRVKTNFCIADILFFCLLATH